MTAKPSDAPPGLFCIEWRRVSDDRVVEPVLLDDSEFIPAVVVKEARAWLQSEFEKYKADPTPTPQIIVCRRVIQMQSEEAAELRSQGLPERIVPEQLMDKAMRFAQQHPARFMKKEEPEKVGPQKMEFECGTAEVLLRHKQTKQVLARYHFIVARDIFSGKTILGPFLRHEIVGRIM